MKRLALLFLLWAATAQAAGSTTYQYAFGRPMYGVNSTFVGNTPPACNAWVPPLSITNVTSIAFFVTGVSNVVDKCSISIWTVLPSVVMLASTGSQSCGTTGVRSATGLTPFSLVAGQKYLVCVCSGLSTGYLSWDDAQAALLRNTLATPQSATAANACDANMNPPASLGTLTNGNFHIPIVLLGTNTP